MVHLLVSSINRSTMTTIGEKKRCHASPTSSFLWKKYNRLFIHGFPSTKKSRLTVAAKKTSQHYVFCDEKKLQNRPSFKPPLCFSASYNLLTVRDGHVLRSSFTPIFFVHVIPRLQIPNIKKWMNCEEKMCRVLSGWCLMNPVWHGHPGTVYEPILSKVHNYHQLSLGSVLAEVCVRPRIWKKKEKNVRTVSTDILKKHL